MHLEVTHHTSDRLELETLGRMNRLWVFFGGGALLVALMAVGSAVHRLTYEEVLACERAPSGDRCHHRQESLFTEDRRSFAARDVVQVQIEQGTDPPELIVVADPGEGRRRDPRQYHLPVAAGVSAAESARRDLEAFVRGEGAEPPTVRRDYEAEWGGPIFAAVLFAAFGLVAILWKMTWTTVRFTPSCFELHRERLLGEETRSVPAERVRKVGIENNRRYGFEAFRLGVVLKDGEWIPLTENYNTSRGHYEKVKETITTFLEPAE